MIKQMEFTEFQFFYTDSEDFDALYEDFDSVTTTENPAEAFFTIECICEDLGLLGRAHEIREDATHMVLDFYPGKVSFKEACRLFERLKHDFRVTYFSASDATQKVIWQLADA